MGVRDIRRTARRDRQAHPRHPVLRQCVARIPARAGRPRQLPERGRRPHAAVWQVAAPSLDFLAPDIYVDDTIPVMEQYASVSNALVRPESRFRAGDLFAAILGSFGVTGYCVFGVEEDGRVDAEYFVAARTLVALTDQIAQARANGGTFGFILDAGVDSISHDFGTITVTVRHGPALFRCMLLDVGVQLAPAPPPQSDTIPGAVESLADTRPFGIVLRTAPDRFLLAGQGVVFDVSSDKAQVEIDEVRELRLTDTGWSAGRSLNGDERVAIVPASTVGVAEITVLRATT